MSAIDSSRSLLGHDDELPIQRWKEDIALRNFNRRRRIWAISLLLMSLAILLIPLTIFFVLDRPWHAEFDAPGRKPSEHPDSAQEPGHERDLKWLLHPEVHVSRDPATRHFSWNISKVIIAPNGVKKDVFLINGITTPSHPVIRKCSQEQINFLVLRSRPALVISSRLRSSTPLRKKCPSTGMAYT